MTPTNNVYNPNKNQDVANDPNPELNPPATVCNTNCHSSPDSQKPFSNFSKKPMSPFFYEAQKNRNPFSDTDVKALKVWLGTQDGVDPKPDVTPAPPPVVTPTSVPAAKLTPLPKPSAEESAAASKKAQELEAQARLCSDPAKKTGLWIAALNFYRIAQDDPAAKKVLGRLESEFKLAKNENGLKFVAAEQLLADGKQDEALQAYRDLGKILADSKDQSLFAKEVKIRNSFLLQQAAAQRISADKPTAISLLREALSLTPSEKLAGQILRLTEGSNKSLKYQREELAVLNHTISDLVTIKANCNTNCHTPNKPKIDDFKYLNNADLPGFSQFNGHKKAAAPEPDLSAYKDYFHLSHQQKLQLYYLDQERKERQTTYDRTLKDVTAILTTAMGKDPGSDAEALESRLLQDAAKDFAPDTSLAARAVGEVHLAAKDYPKAVEALRKAVELNPTDLAAQLSLGEACFGNGEFQGARDAYTAILEKNPHDLPTLRLRAEANSQYLDSLDKKTQADEVTKTEKAISVDRALILALNPDPEKTKLDQLEKQLAGLHDSDQKKLVMDSILKLGQQYLALAGQKYADPKDVELVRSQLNGFASQCFGILSRFAKEDKDPEVSKLAPLFNGYDLLAQGKEKEAVAVFEPIRNDFPEVDKILKENEKQQLRFANVTALEAWEVYNKEGELVQTDSANGVLGSVFDFAEKKLSSDGKGLNDNIKAKWATERQLVDELKSRIQSGKADTILEALKQIQDSGPAELKSRATYYIKDGDRYSKGWPIGNLIDYVSKIPPSDEASRFLLQQAFTLEYDNNAVYAPGALYAVVGAFSPNPEIKETAKSEIEALQGKGSFGRSVAKFVFSMSPESVAVDVALLFVSAGLGNLAKAATLARLGEGAEALWAARAVGIGVEAVALGTGNLGKEAMGHDVKKVFTAEHVLKTYGATLIMIGGLKGFGALGESIGPRAAKALNLVTEEGTTLTTGGKVLVWGIQHGTGITGMIATSHTNQALGLSGKPVGGWKEGLVHDVFGYVQFAVAHKMADKAFGGKMTAISEKQVNEIAFREAVIKAKLQADAFGFKATRGPDGKMIDSPERQVLVGLLLDAKFNKVGFSGDKLASWASGREYGKANDYFREFGLPLQFSENGKLVAVDPGEVSPHEALGIKPGKAKPSPKRADPIDAHLEKLAQGAVDMLNKALDFLFGPPGGGMGGLQPAFAGAYNTVKPRIENKDPAKGPDKLMLENHGESGTDKPWRPLEEFENHLMENDIFGISHDHAKNPNSVTVQVEANKTTDLNVIAEALKTTLPKEVKTLKITIGKDCSLQDIAALAKVAKEKGVEVQITDNVLLPKFAIVDGQVLVKLTELEKAPDLLKEATDQKIDLTIVDAEGHIIIKLENAPIEGGKTSALTAPKLTVTIPESKPGTPEPKSSTPERVAAILDTVAKMDASVLRGMRIEIKGAKLEATGPVKDAMKKLIHNALWNECMSITSGARGELNIKTSEGRFKYTFNTNLPFEKANTLFAEYLAYETAQNLGLKATDGKSVFLQKYFDEAMKHVSDFYQAKSKKGESVDEFSPYVTGGNWTGPWMKAVGKMMNYASTNKTQQAQVLDILDKIEKYSQKNPGDFAEHKGFDGRVMADNAFELMRIFEAAEKTPVISSNLDKILGTVQKVLGPKKYVEIDGAVVGIVYKVSCTKADFASLHEGSTLTDMIDAVETQKWPGRWRFSIPPEDRLMGADPAARTKTPDILVEKLASDGTTEKVATVELTNTDGSRATLSDVRKTIATKAKQIVGHKFLTSKNTGDGIVMLKLYNSNSRVPLREADMLDLVQKALAANYASPDGVTAADLQKIRVNLTIEDQGTEKTYWLEYDTSGTWKVRTNPAGTKAYKGSLWTEPLGNAMGW